MPANGSVFPRRSSSRLSAWRASTAGTGGGYGCSTRLATLGFRYPKRAKFFRSELESFVLLVGEETLDPRQVKGSYAGAMGIAQFIPSSYRHYAVDFDGDGVRDLIESPADCGWKRRQLSRRARLARGKRRSRFRPRVRGDAFRAVVEQGIKPHATLASMRARGIEFTTDAADEELGALLEFETAQGHEYWVGLGNFYVITRYNHSRLYALAVFQLAQSIRQRAHRGRRLNPSPRAEAGCARPLRA